MPQPHAHNKEKMDRRKEIEQLMIPCRSSLDWILENSGLNCKATYILHPLLRQEILLVLPGCLELILLSSFMGSNLGVSYSDNYVRVYQIHKLFDIINIELGI